MICRRADTGGQRLIREQNLAQLQCHTLHGKGRRAGRAMYSTLAEGQHSATCETVLSLRFGASKGTAGSEVKDTCWSSWCASLGEPRLSVARARSSMVHVDAASVMSMEDGLGAMDEMRFRRAGSSPCEASISSVGAACAKSSTSRANARQTCSSTCSGSDGENSETIVMERRTVCDHHDWHESENDAPSGHGA